MEHMQPPRKEADETRVLVLPATTADGIAIRKLLDSNAIPCLVVPSVAAICEAVHGGAGVLVIAEETLATDYGLLFDCIRVQSVWSDLPVILLSSSARAESATFADIVPQLGNVSVVERPVRMSTLVSLIRSSLRARLRQYQVREHLAQQESAQKAIREAQERFRLLVENIKDYAIFMIDTQGRVASWNSGAEHALGYSADEIVGQPAACFFVSEGAGDAVFAREMKEAQATGRATSTGWRARKNGQHMYVEGVLSAVRDEEGRLLGYAKLMKDVTDKRRADAEREHLLQSERTARGEAERSSRMKDEFLATLGHELRTPLNAILGWSQVLRRVGDNAEVGEGLKVIERNARAQAQIIEDLLDMSSIISGKVRLEMRKVDLASVLEASVNAVRPAAETKGIELRLELDPTIGAVRGDPNRLQQVFWNLLTNAVKFTPKAGRVSVTLGRANSHSKISVEDSGEGIDPVFLPYIFERFRQADASTSRRHGGLGIGLSIVKQLVELHGGSIHASSLGNGTGSTFTVELPVMALDTDARAHSGPSQVPARSLSEQGEDYSPSTSLEGVRVLVVDDEADARALIERVLQECEAKVTTAGSAKEAFEYVEREAPDILLSDIGMPKEDGYSLMRRIRNLSGGASQIPAIALTAYARAEDRAKALQAGYQLHLAKPVEPVKLIAMVASLVRPASSSRH